MQRRPENEVEVFTHSLTSFMKKIQFGLEKATGIPVAIVLGTVYRDSCRQSSVWGYRFQAEPRQAGPCEASPAAVISFPFELIYCGA